MIILFIFGPQPQSNAAPQAQSEPYPVASAYPAPQASATVTPTVAATTTTRTAQPATAVPAATATLRPSASATSSLVPTLALTPTPPVTRANEPTPTDDDSTRSCAPGAVVTIRGIGPANAGFLVTFDQRVVSGGTVRSSGAYSIDLIIGNEGAGSYPVEIRVRGSRQLLAAFTCQVPATTPTPVR